MKTVLITGANRGIGLELARQLAERGDRVIATCRRSNSELEASGAQLIENVDVASASSVAGLASALKGVRIDSLVNNAGILRPGAVDNPDFEAMEEQYRVNAMGPLRVTLALRPNLPRGSNVYIVTSRVGSVGDNSSSNYYGYRMSKAAANMAGKNLSIDLADDGINVFLLHPGLVATDMTGYNGISPRESARGLIERMDTLQPEQTGTFWHQDGTQLPW